MLSRLTLIISGAWRTRANCGHALPQLYHPFGAAAYTVNDQVIVIENQIRKELGEEYGQRTGY
jgi:hypothetical protein